jgi:hypothetical protein
MITCFFNISSALQYLAGIWEERPWLKHLIVDHSVKIYESQQEKLRPLIYVYDLPPIYNSRMLQYRSGNSTFIFIPRSNERLTILNLKYNVYLQATSHCSKKTDFTLQNIVQKARLIELTGNGVAR